MAESKLSKKRRQGRDRAQRFRDRKAAAKVATDVPTLDPIDWIEQTLTVPDGPLRGQPFALGDWQKRFIRQAALAPGILEAGLSGPPEEWEIRPGRRLGTGLSRRTSQLPTVAGNCCQSHGDSRRRAAPRD